MNRTRVAQLVNTLSVKDGGPAAAAADLHHHIGSSHMAESYLISFTPAAGPQATDSLTDKTGDDALSDIYYRPASVWSGLLLASTVLKQIRAADIVFLHGYYLWWTPVAAAACVALKTPYFILPHGSLTQRQQAFSRRKKAIFDTTLARPVRRFARGFITTADVERSEVKAKFPNSMVTVARLGVDPPIHHPQTARTGLNSPIRLLSLSRLAPKKRLDLCFEALQQVRLDGMDAELWVAGEGDAPFTRRLQELVAQLDLHKYVHFVGHVIGLDKTLLFDGSDVFLLPSDDENFGIAPIEAMMAGCPVIVSSKVASTLPLASDSCVVLQNPTAASIADCIMSWCADSPQKWSDRRRAAAAQAREYYGWDFAINDWIEVLRASRSVAP